MQAVEFVMEQHDDELWEELIRQCLQKPEMVIELCSLFNTLDTDVPSVYSLHFCNR